MNASFASIYVVNFTQPSEISLLKKVPSWIDRRCRLWINIKAEPTGFS